MGDVIGLRFQDGIPVAVGPIRDAGYVFLRNSRTRAKIGVLKYEFVSSPVSIHQRPK